MRHEDVSLRKAALRVVPREDNANDARAKRSQTLVLPLHPVVGRLYAEYLDIEYGDWDSDYVFINPLERGAGSADDLRQRPPPDPAHRTQYGVCFTAHMLRHTFATLTRRNGAEMETVSELLGHASMATTRSTYVHTTVEDLRRHTVLEQFDVTATEVYIRQKYLQTQYSVYPGVYDYGRCYHSSFPGWKTARCVYWTESSSDNRTWTAIDIQGRFRNLSCYYQQHAWNQAWSSNSFYYGCYFDFGSLPYLWESKCTGGRT